MNEYDSNRIYDTLKKIDFEKTEIQDQADCFILNTCHIRDKAKKKSLSRSWTCEKIIQKQKKTNNGDRRLCCTG